MTSQDPTTEVIIALRQAIIESPEVSALFPEDVDIYEYVPRKAEMPYIHIHEIRSITDDDIHSGKGSDHRIGLSVYEGKRTSANVRAIGRAIHNVIHRNLFNLNGHTMTNCFSQSSVVARTSSGNGFVGRFIYRVLTEEST